MISRSLSSYTIEESSETQLLTPRPHLYIKHLSKHFKLFDDKYYSIVDDLEQKLFNLGIHKIPDFKITEFVFVEDWLNGKKSSQVVFNIFNGMDINSVANKRITRKLVDFMFKNESVAEEVKVTLAELKLQALPLYINYLNMVKKYFEKLSQWDATQIPIVWIEQYLPDDEKGEIKTYVNEMCLNQFINLYNYAILDHIEDGYYLGDNVIHLDESNAMGRCLHWILGPKTYIDIVKKECSIVREVIGKAEKDAFLKVISEY